MNFDILNREILHKGRAFDLQRVRLRLPDGRETNYDIVDHRGAVVVIPIDEEGNILFVRQYRVGAVQELLEMPAGMLEKGEAPETTAAREIREETGMKSGQLQKIGQFFLTPGYSTEILHIFTARELSYDPLEADDDEFLKVVKIPYTQALEMARSGEIRDGKTLACLLLLQLNN